MHEYGFGVGIAQTRSLTVKANSYSEAVSKAREELDRIAEENGDEAPVAWDLNLILFVRDGGIKNAE